MIECETVTRKWGNSLGVRIPKEIVQEERLKENQHLKILILKQHKPVLKTFGLLQGTLKSGQQLKDQARAELYG